MKDYIHNLDNDGLASETILYNIMDSHFIKEFINTEVEILEDNTEEIEELVEYDYINKYDKIDIQENRLTINKLIRAYNKIRKEKSNDK